MNIPEYLKLAAQHECHQMLSEKAGVLAVVIASEDGFDLTSAVTRNLDPSRIAAMSSSMAAIGSVVSQEAQLGINKSITVNTNSGFIYATYIELGNANCILSAITDGSAILAQVVYHCHEIEKRLKSL